jgi:hypothetical protein
MTKNWPNKTQLFLITSINLLLFAITLFNYKDYVLKKVRQLGYSKNVICSCNNKTLSLKKDDYHNKHIPAAKKSPYSFFVENDAVLLQYKEQNKLKEVRNNNGYKIRQLTHSSKHLTPNALAVLNEIGLRFAKRVSETGSKNSYFEVSSLLRTDIQQKRLSKQSSAATKKQSTHSYGVSFDIAFIKTDKCESSMNELEKVLTEMQAEKKILIVPEKHCIHITVL